MSTAASLARFRLGRESIGDEVKIGDDTDFAKRWNGKKRISRGRALL